jgi:hypothetical protein
MVAVPESGAWVTAQHTIGASGQAAAPPAWVAQCPGTGPGSCLPLQGDDTERSGAKGMNSSRTWPEPDL